MTLELNKITLDNHIQKYPNSCVPMAIEFVLKLMGAVTIDYYELQEEKKNIPRWGGDFDGRTISNVLLKMEYNFPRGPMFPLNALFDRITSELDAGRFVNCAWKPPTSNNYHAYIIYGYTQNEFFALSKDFNKPRTEYIHDMKSRLKNIGGSDIITFQGK